MDRDRIEENVCINRVRERVALWRRGGYQGVTRTTRELLEYWRNPEREHKLFFCQIEALGLGNKRNIVVLNDEAHHCYRRRPEGDADDWVAGR